MRDRGAPLLLGLALLLAGCSHVRPATYHYEVLLPEGYESRTAWPLVLYLHGDGGWHDPETLRQLLGDERGRLRLPFVLVAPVWPGPARDWDVGVLARILDRLCRDYRLDRRQVHVTGFSRGGDATWALGERFGDRIASLLPVAGEGDLRLACRMRGVAVWAWHGLDDTLVDPRQSERMVDAIRGCGGDPPRLSLLPGYGHDTQLWNRVFGDREVYRWMLAQRSQEPWDGGPRARAARASRPPLGSGH